MNEYKELLPKIGVRIEGFKGYVPFTVQGALQPHPLTLNASFSSQYLTGILFAYAYAATHVVTIEVEALSSKPYIDLTLEVLKIFGKPIHHHHYKQFIIAPSLFTTNKEVSVAIETDWSSAAYWLIAGAMAGNVMVNGVSMSSTQADKHIYYVLQETAARMSVTFEGIQLQKTHLQPFIFDATHSPDLFPILSVLAGAIQGKSVIIGLHRLAHKESNRQESITNMLQLLGVTYSVEDDNLVITGTSSFKSATINSYNDHRIVMAASIAALHTDGAITIDGAEAVSKSYPYFFRDLASLGVQCTLNK
jgi:3-phosphoshikimate 1-carboxyvinyltransferase